MNKQHQLNQSGLVSIVSTMLIVLIITVITLSLSSLSRRNLRQALDEQLSTQALYAAESGINDAIAKKDTITSDISSCSESAAVFTSPTLDPSGSVRYTCVLMDKTPDKIIADVAQDYVKSYPLTAEGANKISSLIVTWKNVDSNSPASFQNCTGDCFLNSNNWGDRIGVLRLRLLPKNASLTRATLGDTIDIIAHPGTLNGSADATLDASISRQKLIYGNCNSADGTCRMTISNLSTGVATLPGEYFIQMSSFYKDVNVTVEARDASGSPISFTGAQLMIDSTGASSDVLRRLRVNVPISNVSSLPAYVLSSGENLCKRFTTNATETLDDDPSCPAF